MSSFAMLQIKHVTHHPNGDKVTASEKGLLMQIADDHNEDRAYAWPSIPALSRRSGLSVNQARRLLHRMVAIGTLESRPTVGLQNGARGSNEYRFWFDRPFDGKKTRHAEQVLRIQEQRLAQRPKQMKLTESEGTAAAPTDPFFAQSMGGEPIADGSVPPVADGSGPSHTWEGPPTVHGREPLPPVGGLQHKNNSRTTPDQLKSSTPDTFPLPPHGGGVRQPAGDEHVLPFLDLRMTDAKYRLELGKACAWLREQIGVPDERFERTLQAALAQHCKLERTGLHVAARLAFENFWEYQWLSARGHLRYQYGPPKFFAHGHWARRTGWPITEEGHLARRASSY